jgi:hypothetical protein
MRSKLDTRRGKTWIRRLEFRHLFHPYGIIGKAAQNH